MMLNAEDVLRVLNNTKELPHLRVGRVRTIYESAHAGHYYIDYASYAGGSTEEVPREVIDDMERQGNIVRAFPDSPKVNAWRLALPPERSEG